MAGGQFFNRWGDWIRTALTIAAVAGFAVFDNRYVTRADYTRDRGNAESTMETLRTSLDAIRTSIALQEQQLKTLTDHESRLRAIEFGRRVSANN